MPWWQLSVECNQAQLPLVEDILLELGAVSISISDAHDEPLYEPLPGEQPLWSASIVTGLFDQDRPIESLHDDLLGRLPDRLVATIRRHELADQPWERVHLERYHPMRFGRRTWVCPSWIAPPEPTACTVILDPGVAFGTGSHATTALCLEFLDQHAPEGLQVMDYGCGSGVLAIAAAKLGAAHVHCIDIDPQALAATQDNIRRNHLDAGLFTLHDAGGVPTVTVDYLIANILSGPLMDLQPRFASLTHRGSRILLSGILDTQVETVMQTYSRHFDLDAATIRDQWCRVSGRRR